MTIDRVATNAQSQYMLAQIMQAESAVNQSQNQVSTGLVATDYTGMGDKTALLAAAQSAVSRANSYQSATQLAVNQTNLQDTQLTSLSSLAGQLKQDILSSVANNDGSTLMNQADGIYQQIVQILNSQDASGNYIYGGDKNNIAPVTAATLSQLGSLTGVSGAFANGTKTASVRVADGETVKVGLLASDVGTGLLQTLQSLVQFNNGANGNLGTTLTSAQSSFLSSAVQGATSASEGVNNVAATNGDVYTQLQNAVTQQQSMSTLYKGFVSNLQDVDMPTAITQLNQDQTALQAAMQVTAQLGKNSLLNYLTA
jgi:flagellar hook-associated protein 3 FlgL